MKFSFAVKRVKSGGVPLVRVKLFTVEDNGIVFDSGTLSLLHDEYEAFKFMLQEGVSRYQNQEVTLEFNDQSSVKAYLEGE